MLVLDLEKVKRNFTEICHEAYKAESRIDYLAASGRAHGYLAALIDAFDITIARQVYDAAEASFNGEVTTSFGIPDYQEKEKLQPV